MVDDVLLLIVYNRLPMEEEIENGVESDQRMVDSAIILDDERYEEFIESEEAVELDYTVTAIHRITEQGYIIGL